MKTAKLIGLVLLGIVGGFISAAALVAVLDPPTDADRARWAARAKAAAAQAAAEERARVEAQRHPYAVGSKAQYQAWRQHRARQIAGVARILCKQDVRCDESGPGPDPDSASVQSLVDNDDRNWPDAWKKYQPESD